MAYINQLQWSTSQLLLSHRPLTECRQ